MHQGAVSVSEMERGVTATQDLAASVTALCSVFGVCYGWRGMITVFFRDEMNNKTCHSLNIRV
jgi:hypothetical protein